jgi:hypothetical protein
LCFAFKAELFNIGSQIILLRVVANLVFYFFVLQFQQLDEIKQLLLSVIIIAPLVHNQADRHVLVFTQELVVEFINILENGEILNAHPMLLEQPESVDCLETDLDDL